MTKTSTRKPCRGMTRARKAARWSTILGLATLFASPAPAQYVWSLGDLADVSSRFDVLWDTGAWADPYDTEAELLAAGWTSFTASPGTYTIDGDGAGPSRGARVTFDCRAEGVGSGTDRTSLVNFIAEVCDPNGVTPGNCENTIVKLASDCHYDILAGAGNIDGDPALSLNYSNLAVIGEGMNSSHINCNDFGDQRTASSPCIGNRNDWRGPPNNGTTEVGTEYGWASGNTVGTRRVTLTGGDCSTFAVGDRMVFKGTGEEGLALWFANEVASRSGCTIDLVDPIRKTVPTRSTARETTAPTQRNIYLMNFSVGFPHFPDGVNRDLPSYAGAPTRFSHVSGLIMSGLRIGPFANIGPDFNAMFRNTIRHSEIGPCNYCKRRGNNGQLLIAGRSGYGSTISVFDNVFTDAAKRFMMLDSMGNVGSWYGFNYMNDQLATAPETGNHCIGVGSARGIPIAAGAGFTPEEESVIFMGHNPNPNGKSGSTLIEANDLNCRSGVQGVQGDFNRHMTFFRNRMNRVQGYWINWPGSYRVHHANWIANRFNSWPADASFWPNVLGRWNVAESSAGAFTAPGAAWPTTSTYKNYVDAGPHDDYAATRIPPSLALRQDSAPSWWCQESGPWNETWSFAYGDGGENGGVQRKLPAQIRHEGRACTPPSGTVDSLPAPVLFE